MTNSEARQPDDAFLALLSTLELDASEGRGRAHPVFARSWAQGRAIFGGVQAGVALEAMATLVPEGGHARRPRSLHVGFVGPLEAELEAELDLELLRHGRSATSVRAQISQGGSVRTTAFACFAAARESVVELAAPPRPPQMRGPEGLSPMPYVEGVVPAFAQHFEMRLVSPEGGHARAETGAFSGWVRLREPILRPGPAATAALVDAWPTPMLLTLGAPTRASSLSWALDFLDTDDSACDQWRAYVVETDRASGGWVHARASVEPHGQAGSDQHSDRRGLRLTARGATHHHPEHASDHRSQSTTPEVHHPRETAHIDPDRALRRSDLWRWTSHGPPLDWSDPPSCGYFLRFANLSSKWSTSGVEDLPDFATK